MFLCYSNCYYYYRRRLPANSLVCYKLYQIKASFEATFHLFHSVVRLLVGCLLLLALSCRNVTAIHDWEMYADVTFPMVDLSGKEYTEKGAWLLVDGGYHKWRCLQCPLKHSAIPRETLWSEWAETVRKDVECVFGVLKGRFRC